MHQDKRPMRTERETERRMGMDYVKRENTRIMTLETITDRLIEDCFLDKIDRLEQIEILANRLNFSENYYELFNIFTTMISAGISNHIHSILFKKTELRIFDYNYGRWCDDEPTITVYGLILDIIGFHAAILIIEKVENPEAGYNLPKEENVQIVDGIPF